MEHLFDIDIAKKYGVNAAIIIRHFQFWIIKNKTNNKHLYDSKTWTYCSVQALTEIFPYWSPRQIRVILDKLLKKKIIMKGNYNPRGYDHTTWYAFIDEKRFVKIDKSNCQNGQKDLSKRANRIARNDQPIPDTLTNPIPIDVNTDKTNQLKISPEEILGLDLQIADARNILMKQLGVIFNPNNREAKTFARITRHIVLRCQRRELPMTIFNDAVEWARQAKASNANRPKALFVSKIKQETGFAPQKLLLQERSDYGSERNDSGGLVGRSTPDNAGAEKNHLGGK